MFPVGPASEVPNRRPDAADRRGRIPLAARFPETLGQMLTHEALRDGGIPLGRSVVPVVVAVEIEELLEVAELVLEGRALGVLERSEVEGGEPDQVEVPVVSQRLNLMF